MVAIIKNNFRLASAKEFLKNFSLTVTDKNHYLFVGKPIPWRDSENTSVNSSTNADLRPPMPQDTTNNEKRIWDEMLGLKKIGPNDVSLVIPRSDWRPDTIYAFFDDNDNDLYHRPTLEDVKAARDISTTTKAGTFYVLNSLNDLFICVSNNNRTVSVTEPRRLADPTQLIENEDDGYVWKFITSISSGDAVKFLTDAWIPLENVTDTTSPQGQVQNSATPGELLSVVVKNLTDATRTSAQFDQSVASCEITISTTVNTQAVISSTSAPSAVDNAYTGYQLHITDTSNTLHIFTVTAYSGTTKTLTVDRSLAGITPSTCSILPQLRVHSNGTVQPVVQPILDSSKKIVGIKILNRGENSKYISIAVVRPSIGSASSDTTTLLPNIRPVLSPVDGLGKNPERDLGAFYAMISTQITATEGEDQDSLADFPVKNDYRQIGILQNVVSPTTNILATQSTLRATKRLKVRFVNESDLGNPIDPGFKSDEEILIKTSTSIDADPAIGKIRAIDFRLIEPTAQTPEWQGEITFVQNPETEYCTLEVGQKLSGTSGSPVAKATILEIHDEELKKFNGEILYIENRRPVIRSAEQIEDIKTIIEF